MNSNPTSRAIALGVFLALLCTGLVQVSAAEAQVRPGAEWAANALTDGADPIEIAIPEARDPQTPQDPQAPAADDAVSVEESTASAAAVNPNTPGVITGYVTKAETGEGLAYTNIIVYRVSPNGFRAQDGGTIAINRGQYFARLNPGTYSLSFLYLGYEQIDSEPIVVGPGETIEFDVAMKIKPVEFKAFTVQGTAITNTAVAQLIEKKKAVAVQEAISAEEIAKSTDSDAAEALERVTGLSVVGGKFVFVRGLGDRYSSTSLNGAGLSSPEPNRRTVPLDIFPAAMLDNVVVQKAFTPDMDGEFGGGNIDVQTKGAIDRRQFSQKFGLGYAENVMDNGYIGYAGGRTDWLGIDDGTRALPQIFSPYADTKLPGKRNILGEGLAPQQLAAVRESFPNVWTPRKKNGATNFSYSGQYADSYQLFGKQGSFLLAGSLSNSYNTREYDELYLKGGNAATGAVNTSSVFESVQSDRSTLLGLTGTFNYRLTQSSRLTYNALLTRGSDDKARVATGENEQSEVFLQNTLTYIERQLMFQSLRGEHKINENGTRFDWQLAYSQADRNEPDRRFSEFKQVDFTVFNEDDEVVDSFTGWGKSPLGFPFVRVFGESQEDDIGVKLNYEYRLPTASWGRSGVKVGYAFRDRERFTKYRRFGITCQGCEFDGSGDGEQVFDRSTYEDPTALDDMILTETTDSSDRYDAGQETSAMYAMADFDIASTFRVVGGARYESSTQFALVESRNVAASDRKREEFQLSNDNWLPALNLTYRMTERVNLRGAYSQTVNRPEMRELSPFSNFNYEENINEKGNPELQQGEIQAFDTRLEFFPSPRRYMAVSLFRKNFDRPIERLFNTQAAGSFVQFPGNGEDGYLQGWEVEWRGGLVDAVQGASHVSMATAWTATRPFWLLGRVPGLGFFDALAVDAHFIGTPDLPRLNSWGFTFNYSKIESEVTVDRTRVNYEVVQTPLERRTDDPKLSTQPLTGQNSYALNAGLIYDTDTQDFSLMVKAFGDRLQALGVAVPDVYENVPVVLDSAFTQQLGSSLKIKFSLENILDQRSEFYYDLEDGQVITGLGEGREPLRRVWHDGRRFGVSLSYSL